MGFLRRILGGGAPAAEPEATASAPAPAPAPTDDAVIETDERARELELARFDQDRTSDLVRRQQRWADRSWTPPAQGGERRSDDGDRAEG